MKRLIYFAGLYTISAGLLELASFLLLMWLARAMAVNDYAQFGLMYSLQTGITTFGIVGILEAVVGFLREHRGEDEQRRLFSATNTAFLIVLSLTVVIAIALFMIFKARAFPCGNYLTVLVSGALLGYSTLQAHFERLQEDHPSALCFGFLMPLGGVAGSAIAFFLQGTAASFFLGSALGLAAVTTALRLKSIGFYGLAKRTHEAKPVLLRVVPFIGVAAFGWLSGYGNNIFVQRIFKPSEVAKFTFALTIASIMVLVTGAMNQVWSPRFYRITHDRPFDEIEKKNRRFFRLQGVILGLTAAATLIFYSPVITAAGGNLVSYSGMRLEMFFLLAGYILLSPWHHCTNHFLAQDMGSRILSVTTTTGILGIGLWLGLMLTLGPIGIYLGFAGQMLIRSIGIVMAARKHWPVRASWEGVLGGLAIAAAGLTIARHEPQRWDWLEALAAYGLPHHF